MTGLKNMLLAEQDRLEQIIRQVKAQLVNAPEGTLRLSKSNGCTQYYHCTVETSRNGIYIPSGKNELIRQLAQKTYAEKVLKFAEKRLAQIKKLAQDYSEDEIEKIYLKEHVERKKLIDPVEKTWEQQFEMWKKKEYKGKEFYDGTPLILTERGERVRSKSEKIMADYFYRRGIEYKYECPLYLKRFGWVFPDFTFLTREKGEVYWEHLGMMDDPIYAAKAIRKINAYENNGIFQGENLILTYEAGQIVLDTRKLEQFVNKYLV